MGLGFRADMINAKIWCLFQTTPRPFSSPDAFLSFRGRAQEQGGQTQGVQRTPVGKPRVPPRPLLSFSGRTQLKTRQI